MTSHFLKKIILSPLSFFLLVSFSILVLNLTPLFTLIHHSPPGRTFGLIHNNAQDFYFYLSLMNKGANGDVLTTDPFTTETHQPSIIFSYFVWAGKLASFLGIPYAVFYHLIRIGASIILLGLVFFLLRYIQVPFFRLSFIFFIFASPFMHTINDNGRMITVPFMYWWTGVDSIRRIAYLPHHMIGNILLIATIVLTVQIVKKFSWRYTVAIAIIFALLSFIHPPSLFILLVTILPTCIVFLILRAIIRKDGTLLIKKNIFPQEFRKPFLSLLLSCLLGGVFLLAMVAQTSKGFPWTQYIAWEKTQQFPLTNELLGAFGVLLPLAFIGIVSSFLSKKFERILIICWFVIPILLVPFASRFQISNIRLIQGVPYLPLAILAVFGLEVIQLKILSQRLIGSWVKISKYVLPVVILIIFSIFTYPTVVWSLKDQIREYWPIFGNIYLDNRLNTAFTYINSNFPKNTKTLGTFYTGNYLPAYTHTISFIGHFGYTYNIGEKEKNTRKFFENKMSEGEAKEFLMSNNIDLIWQGPEEKPIYKDHLYPKLLKPVYDKEEVTMYIPQ